MILKVYKNFVLGEAQMTCEQTFNIISSQGKIRPQTTISHPSGCRKSKLLQIKSRGSSWREWIDRIILENSSLLPVWVENEQVVGASDCTVRI